MTRQELIYDKTLHAVRTTIKKPFFYAGEHLNWGWKSQGLGFNLEIIDKCLNLQCDLIVFVEDVGYRYRIKYDRLRMFLMTYNCDYYVRNSKYKLKVISFDWFDVVEES